MTAIVTARSQRITERLLGVMPGANTRDAAFYAPFPLVIERGEGPLIWDVDGNELIDLLNNYTSLVHGHAHPSITEALVRQAALGTVFPAPTELQAELAERVCARVPGLERLRFVNSGTEAVMHAVRAARAFTGRDQIIKATGAFHGSWEQVSVSGGPTRGTPAPVTALAHLVPYNDTAALEEAMLRHGDQVAAILLEPVTVAGGVVAGAPEFFAAARALADRYGALLVIDEVVTLRLGVGGYQPELDVVGDVMAFGKLLGGGMPVGAFGGRADVMALFDPRETNALSHSGTFNGNSMTMAAGCVALDLLTAAEVARINELGTLLARRLREELAPLGPTTQVTQCGSLVQAHFETAGPIRRGEDVNYASPLLTRVHRAALEEGVSFAPRGLMCISTAMDEALVERAASALGRAARRAHVMTTALA